MTNRKIKANKNKLKPTISEGKKKKSNIKKKIAKEKLIKKKTRTKTNNIETFQ